MTFCSLPTQGKHFQYAQWDTNYEISGCMVSVSGADAYLILHPVWNPRGAEGIQVNLIETIWKWKMKVVAKVVST